MAGVSQRYWTVHPFCKSQPEQVTNVLGRWCATFSYTNAVPKFVCVFRMPRNDADSSIGQTARGEFGVDLREKIIIFSGLFYKARWDERGEARPSSRTDIRANQSVDRCTYSIRETPKIIESSFSCDSELDITHPALGPRPPKRGNGSLSGLAKAHSGVNEEMVNVLVPIKVEGKDVRMAVAVAQRFAMRILAGKFRAMD